NSPDGTKDDPLARAVDLFARNLTINVDKKSSVIELYFNNPDPTMASDALKVLEKDYFELRTKLYGDVQAPIVKVQQENVGKQLADADTALAAFKQQHDISSFTDRRTILLKQQGDLGNGAREVREHDRRAGGTPEAVEPAAWGGDGIEEGHTERIRRPSGHGAGVPSAASRRPDALSGFACCGRSAPADAGAGNRHRKDAVDPGFRHSDRPQQDRSGPSREPQRS